MLFLGIDVGTREPEVLYVMNRAKSLHRGHATLGAEYKQERGLV